MALQTDAETTVDKIEKGVLDGSAESKPEEKSTETPESPEAKVDVASTDEGVESKPDTTSGDPVSNMVTALSGTASEVGPEDEVETPKLELDLDNEEVKAAMEDPEKFAALVQNTANKIVESFYMNLPNLIGESVARQTTLKTAAERFWEDNDDLKPVNRYVAQVANDLWLAHPTLDAVDLFRMAGENTRKALNLTKKAIEVDKQTKTEKPPFAGKTSDTGEKDFKSRFMHDETTQSKQQKEMLKFAGLSR